MRGSWFVRLSAMLVAFIAFIAVKPHSEDALMGDWSAPPPWPIFIGANVIAAALRAGADALTPPPIKMLDLTNGYQVTMMLHVAQSLKIADFVAKGPATAAAIAAACGSSVDRTERLMYALAANGIFTLQTDGPAGPAFVNSKLSAVLRTDHPNSMRGFVGHTGDDTYPAWMHLLAMFKDDEVVAWDIAFPKFPNKKNGIWSRYAAVPELEEQFSRAMTSIDGLGAKAMEEDYPFKDFDRVIDVGGSRGSFLHVILAANPSLKGVVFDQNTVIAGRATPAWAPGGEFYDAADRASLVPGSFFDVDTIPTGQNGDAFLLRYILHDWDSASVDTILTNVRAAMGSSTSTLVIGECAMPDRDTLSPVAPVYGIDMQMLAIFGDARERTPTEWKSVLAKNGFRFDKIVGTRSLVHFVVATPV